MIANITVRERSDSTKVKWGPLMGGPVWTPFLPDVLAPLTFSRDVLSVQRFVVKTIWKRCCALQHWACSASFSHTLLPASLACCSGMCPFIKSLLWAGPSSWRGQNKTLSKVSIHYRYKLEQWQKSHVSSWGFTGRWTVLCNNLSLINTLEGRWGRRTQENWTGIKDNKAPKHGGKRQTG